MNIEKLYGDLQSQTNLTAPELSKVMASAKSPQRITRAIPKSQKAPVKAQL